MVFPPLGECASEQIVRKRTSPADLTLAPALRDSVRRRLIEWYDKNRRSLPWRDEPTPYGVWVSEIMLQQTRVEVVRDYYARWMRAFPDIYSLAAADEETVLSHWQGLGYYSRARRLLEGAVYVTSELGGELPREPGELQKIPGIGPYSAGAISSIAFGERSPLVDGNVIRVLARHGALSGDPTKSPLKQQIWSLAAELVPERRAGDFNQALMELGALICSPQSPSCHACPLRKTCRAHLQGEATNYPHLSLRKKPTPLSMVVVSVWHRASCLLEKLPPDARWWAGLYAMPFTEIGSSESAAKAARRVAQEFLDVSRAVVEVQPHFVHTVTRYKITLTPVRVSVKERAPLRRSGCWVPRGELKDVALPAPHRKALKLMMPGL